MASREWLITKVTGLLMGIALLVSTGVGAANLITSLRRDVDRNEERINKHENADEKKWEKIEGEISELDRNIDLLNISSAEQATQFAHILREIEKLNLKFDKFEVAQ
jgi:peptidoglycan hydrolase CwlO-like protein